MRTRPNTIRALVAAIFATLVLSLVTACSGSGSSQASQQCFEQPNATQAAQLQQYMQNQGNQASITQDTSGNPTVCVIDAGGNMRYYDRNDGFQNYLMFAMMAGHVHPVVGAGVLMGDIDPIQALILNSLLVSPNSSGQLYHPYVRGANGTFRSNTTVIKNSHVTNVYYGRSTMPVSYASTQKSGYKQPAGYSSTTFKTGTSVVQESKGGKISTLKDVSSGSVIKNGGKIPTTTKGKSGSGLTGTNKSKTSGGSKFGGSKSGSHSSGHH